LVRAGVVSAAGATLKIDASEANNAHLGALRRGKLLSASREI
jgi:hypothetical protein